MRRKRNQWDFQAELQAHVQIEADQLQADGMSPAEAEAAARRAFGNRTRAEERFYESGRTLWWDHLVRDLRFAARVLAKDRRFSVLAILGLALGIGISTAIFTMIDASVRVNQVQTDPKSYVGITRIVGGHVDGGFSYFDYGYFRDRATTLRMVSAESGRHRFLMIPPSAGEAQEAQGRFESANFLAAMGLRPALGRTFSTAEEQEGGAPVAMLNYRSWQRRFGADSAVLGRTVTLNAHPLTIIGIAEARFGQADPSDFYLPLGAQPLLLGTGNWLHDPSESWLRLDARLRPGVSIRQAEAELEVLVATMRQAHPAAADEGGGTGHMTLTPGGVNPIKAKSLLAIVITAVIAVSMILLIACSNLANLLLARAVVRQREIGVRLSLGASRGRLIAQLLTESMLLALGGGALGLLFSHWLANTLILMTSAPGLDFELKIEPAVVLYAIALSIATGLSFGLAPALAATRTNLAQAMHGEGLPAAALSKSRRVWSARNALVIVPLAVSLMLLLGAGIAVRRAQRSYMEGPQFDASRLIATSFRLNMQGYDQARTMQFQEDFRQRIAGMPGVTSVALATAMPLSNGMGWFPLAVEGKEAAAREQVPHADYNVISPGYFQTVGARMVRGREFTAADREGGSPVVMVNQDFGRRYWPDEDAIGKRVRLKSGAGVYFQVIGVAPDLQDANSPDNSVRPMVYIPYAQSTVFFSGMKIEPPAYQVSFLTRTEGDPAPVKNLIRQQAHAMDSSLRTTIQTVRESLEARLGPLRTISMLLSALGGLALLMASVGIYAILAYAVSQRTREIGIRAALGARRGEVVALLMRRTVVLIAWGIGLGLVGAIVLTRVFARTMSEVGELDAATCVAVSLFLAAVALLASYLPARKALRVDPAQALRSE
jgi:predicted permease